jgi:hypothetical protein
MKQLISKQWIDPTLLSMPFAFFNLVLNKILFQE